MHPCRKRVASSSQNLVHKVGGAPASPAVQRHICALGIEQPFSPWSILPAQCQPVASLVTSSNIYDAGSESLSHSEKPQLITALWGRSLGKDGHTWGQDGPAPGCPGPVSLNGVCMARRFLTPEKLPSSLSWCLQAPHACQSCTQKCTG